MVDGNYLYYMLCGHLPFKGNKEVIIAEKIVNDDLEFDEEEWEVRSKRVRELIVSCLKKEPEERITIDDFLNQIDRHLEIYLEKKTLADLIESANESYSNNYII